MLKNNNALREIVYIFIWLVGIILFYTLIYKWFSTPSSSVAEAVVVESNTPKGTTTTQIVVKKEPSVAPISVSKVEEKVNKKQEESVVVQPLEVTAVPKEPVEVAKEEKNIEAKQVSPEVVPSTPIVSKKVEKELSSPTPKTIVATTQVSEKQPTKEAVTQIEKKEFKIPEEIDAYTKLLRSARELVIMEAEKGREEALKVLRANE